MCEPHSGNNTMSYKSPWYSEKKKTVHYNNNKCTEGNNIERENVRSGTGGLPVCKHCQDLNREGK